MNQQKITNQSDLPEWGTMINLLRDTTTIRDFCIGLRWVFTSYNFSTSDYREIKNDIINVIRKFSQDKNKISIKPRKRI